jgi:amidohydrolase
MNLDGFLPELAARIATVRRDLHAHPELAFEEARTAGIVAAHLHALDLDVHTGIAKTGVVARLKFGNGSRAIGLRADMDALPLPEMNTFAHRSCHEGRMHACGHDGHTAMLLGAAEALVKLKNDVQFDGTVHFIFQPAEEHEGGGRVMVEEGLFERFPMQRVFGLHNWPGLPVGSIAVTEGPVMAGADRFEITINARGAHAAMPHQGTDAILAGAALVQSLQSLVSRSTDPLDSAVVSVTRFHAGHADNILPEQGILGGTVRCFRPDLQDALEAGLRRVCQGIEATYQVGIDLDFARGYPPTINAADAAAACRKAALQVVGSENVLTNQKPSMGAEDFAYLSREVPGCYVWLGNGPGAGGCMLHSSHYDFNDAIIATGIRYWVQLVRQELALG